MIKAMLGKRGAWVFQQNFFFSSLPNPSQLNPLLLSLFIIANFSTLPLSSPLSISQSGQSIRACAKQSVPGGTRAFSLQPRQRETLCLTASAAPRKLIRHRTQTLFEADLKTEIIRLTHGSWVHRPRGRHQTPFLLQTGCCYWDWGAGPKGPSRGWLAGMKQQTRRWEPVRRSEAKATAWPHLLQEDSSPILDKSSAEGVKSIHVLYLHKVQILVCKKKSSD